MQQNTLTRPKAILFSVNDTLLDMTEIKRKVNRLLDSKRAYALWLEVLLHFTLVENSTGQYHDFESIARAAMDQAAKTVGSESSESMKEEVLHLMKHLPLRDGVQKGLSLLHDQGYPLFVFTNTSEHSIRERMEPTGLISYFESVLSVDEIQKFKPEKACYLWAAQKLDLDPSEILMVSAHGWDICGALNAGLEAAFVRHDDAALYPFSGAPQFIAPDLTELASLLESRFKTREDELLPS